MKTNKRWVSNIKNNTCVKYDQTKPYPPLDLDLKEYIRTTSGENAGGAFEMNGNGKNFPKFEMNIRLLKFGKNQGTPSFADEIGVWKAGYGDANQIVYKDNKDLVQHLAHIVFRVVTVVVCR